MRTVTFLAQYVQIRNYTKLVSKKHRVFCHNLFLLRKRKPTSYLTLQEDHNVSIYDLSTPRHPKKVKFRVCFYQSLTDNMAFLK